MKTLISFFAILFFSTGLFAQKFIQEWNKDYPVYGAYGGVNSIFPTTDGNLLLAGGGRINNVGTMFFMKTDTAGEVIWETNADEQFNSNWQYSNRIIQDNEGNYVIIGIYNPGFSLNTYFTKLSPEGTILGTHINGGQYDYQGGHDIIQTSDSGYLVSAQKENYGMGMCLALRKLDSDGRFTWDTTFVHPEDSTAIVGNFGRMAKINNTTFVLTGNRDYVPGSLEDLDIIQAKIRVFNDSVKLLRLTTYELSGANEKGYDILTLPNDEGFIMCGEGDNENNPGAKVGVIMRTDIAGNQIWKKTYTRALNSNTSFIGVLQDDDGNILVMARTQAGSSDVSLLKYSTDGALLQKTHLDNGWNETGYSMALDQDGKIYLGENHTSYSNVGTAMYKVKDICPVNTPEVALENDQPILGDNVIVHVQNTKDVWQFSLLLLKDSTVMATYMGNNGTLDFTASGLTNDDVSQGLVVSVIEPGVDCIKYSDTLYFEFICPVEAPAVSLGNSTPNIGDDVFVIVANTSEDWKYHLIKIMENIALDSVMGNGGTFTFTISGLTNVDVSEGLVVSTMLPGFNECMEYSDTLYFEFIDGVEDIYQNSLQIVPNPTQDYVTISDAEHQLSNLAVYNLSGKFILEKSALSAHNKIKLSDLPGGIYLFRITYDSGSSIYRKVLKQ